MLLYYVTDRTGFTGTGYEQRSAVIRKIEECARAGVNFIQLREKDLPAREFERLGVDAIRAVRDNSRTTKLLINARSDLALAIAADGVHLPGGEIAPSEVRVVWMKSSRVSPVIGVSAHSLPEVRYAEAHGADFAVLAPVFEKVKTSDPGIGLDALRSACAGILPAENAGVAFSRKFAVLALGGVNLTNAVQCLEAGASGIAGIRLFQTGNVAETVRHLRNLEERVQLGSRSASQE